MLSTAFPGEASLAKPSERRSMGHDEYLLDMATGGDAASAAVQGCSTPVVPQLLTGVTNALVLVVLCMICTMYKSPSGLQENRPHAAGVAGGTVTVRRNCRSV